jgi:hypothetical protein
MNCSEVLELVPLLLTGELDSRRTELLTAHLAGCPGCALQLSDARTLDEQVRLCVLAEHVDSEALERRVMQRIAVESKPSWNRFRTWPVAAGFACVALVAVAGYESSPKPTGLFTAAARDHRFEVVDRQPRKWRSDLTSVSQLAASRGINNSLIEAVAKAGYSFKEARLCRLDGFVFLHLVYIDSGHEFSVFLREEDGGKVSGSRHGSVDGKPIYTSDLGAQHVAGFADGALKALVVTDQPDAALRIAQAAAKVI